MHGERYRVLDTNWHLRRARPSPPTRLRAPSTPPSVSAVPYATLRTPSRARVAPTVTTSTTAGASTSANASPNVSSITSVADTARPAAIRTTTSIAVANPGASPAITPTTVSASTPPLHVRRRSQIHNGDRTTRSIMNLFEVASSSPTTNATTDDNADDDHTNTSHTENPASAPRSPPNDFDNPWI